jgi:pimeloyl-ACP methyl ester carboxylesterase
MTFTDQEIFSRFPVGYFPLHPNISLNFEMNRFWGWCGEKQMLEELKAAAPRIKSYDDWTREMFALRDQALAQGRRLPAAYYAKCGSFFASQDDPRTKPAIEQFTSIVLEENHVGADQRFMVPYQQGQLAAYRFTPPNPRGTIVIFGGYDSYILEWLPAAIAFRDAGLDTVIFDGPGQGTVLDAGMPMTPDWHLPVGAVLDYFKLTDITLLGFSLGGCLVLRAAAFESRVKRAICWDVCTDVFAGARGWLKGSGLDVIADNSSRMSPEIVNAAIAAGRKTDLLSDWVLNQGCRVMGAAAPAELFPKFLNYRTQDISHLVTQPVLLMAGSKDHGIPLQMLPDQQMWLTQAHSITARVFTEAESAQNHCQIGNQGLALKVILGWLDEVGGRKS